METLVALRETALQRGGLLRSEEYKDKGLLDQALHTALTPLRVVTSPPAIKAYLTTLLFFLTSCALISVSTTAYLIFYYNFIPQIGLTQTVHLQYDTNVHPRATIGINSAALISQQPYDILIKLHMPRSPSNLGAGNFMLDLSLLPDGIATSDPSSYLVDTADNPPIRKPLAHSRRPAILPYNSHVTSLSHKIVHLPFHLLSLKDLDTSVLDIPMFERLSFARGRTNVPTKAYLEIQSQIPPSGCPPVSNPGGGIHLMGSSDIVRDTALQIYSAELTFHARFEGLRYYVYNYRILSFLIFSWLFYTFALSSMAVVWALMSVTLSARKSEPGLANGRIGGAGRVKQEDTTPSSGRTPKVKAEDDDGAARALEDIDPEGDEDSDLDVAVDPQTLAAGLSSTERTFPTVGRHARPLHYTPSTTTAPSDDAESSSVVQREDATHDAEDEGEDEADEEEEGEEARGPVITPLSSGQIRDGDIKDEEDGNDGVFQADSGIGTSMESEVVVHDSGLVRRRSSRETRRGNNELR